MKAIYKIIPILIITFCVMMIVFASNTAIAVKEALHLWLDDVVPTLLPFLVLSGVIKETGYTDRLPVKLYPFVMGVLSGYPVGAGISADYYVKESISEDMLRYILSYSMVTGPAFIIGTVGIQFFHSLKVGAVIAAGHYLGAFANSVIYKKGNLKEKPSARNRLTKGYFDALTYSIINTFKILCIILSYIILFTVLLQFINMTGIFNCEYLNVIKGIMEITVGCSSLYDISMPMIIKATAASFFISFGGLSVMFQTMSMIKDTPIKFKEVIRMKLNHGIISAILTFSLGTFMIYF